MSTTKKPLLGAVLRCQVCDAELTEQQDEFGALRLVCDAEIDHLELDESSGAYRAADK